MIGDVLALAYPWTKALHVISVITWMAGLFYLPRLYVYHVEAAAGDAGMSATFKTMERKLLRVIMNPAMVASWLFGLLLVFTPGVVDLWSDGWFHVKFIMLLGMTWFHHALGRWRRDFAEDRNVRPGRYYRLMNEVPTLLMIAIVVMAVVKPF
jgi:protoporphyrinogen IX oxidase